MELHFPNLVRLEITHEYALGITDDDVTLLAIGLPSLVSLDLNGAPGNIEPGPTKLTIRCLRSLATWLHELMDLSLFLDARQDIDPTLPPVAFQSLEQLFLCTSPIDEAARERVTLHLARTLPTYAVMTSERDYVSEWDYTPPPFEPSRFAIWKRVEADLELIMSAKRDWLADAQAQVSKTQW
ncbi:unnamed protein product [Peniophora sp. CBMAI 1063]|nr:unnamed protein product [Peniophora sp. CBMAI 1063]